jgi:ribosomal protein S18 acetylase RimI-like enzyme
MTALMTEKRAEPIIVRDATPGDIDFVVAANLALASETEDKRLDPVTLREGVRLALDDPTRCLYFIAEIAGKPAGQTMITYEWSDWQNGWLWWLQSVYVEPPYRRRGVFRALYEHVRRLAVSKPDVKAIRLYVYRDNQRAQHTYDSLGFSDAHYLVMEDDLSPGKSTEHGGALLE